MTTSGSDGIDAMDDAWRVAVLDRLAEEGLKLTDPEQQDTIIGMLDAVAFQLSANWLGGLVDQTDDLALLHERLGIFGSVLATLIERELEQALLGPAYVALDNETFRSLVVLSLATVKYIDWQAQAQGAGLAEDADETGALFAAADEAIGAVITRAA